MSDSKNSNFLKITITRASGKRTEYKIVKSSKTFFGVLPFTMRNSVSELIAAFEFALYDASLKGKDEINITFNV